MAQSEEKQFVNLPFDAVQLKRIDDFRFKHRFPSRTAAIKWLLDWALTQSRFRQAER